MAIICSERTGTQKCQRRPDTLYVRAVRPSTRYYYRSSGESAKNPCSTESPANDSPKRQAHGRPCPRHTTARRRSTDKTRESSATCAARLRRASATDAAEACRSRHRTSWRATCYAVCPAAARPSRPSGSRGKPTSSSVHALARAAYILGWLTILLGLFAGIPAIICGHLALRRANLSLIPEQVKRKARIGLALGYIVSFLWLLLIIWIMSS